MTYFSNQIVPSIDLIGEPTSVFPAVTICNLNAFDVGKPGVQSEMLRILRGTPTSEFKVNATNRKSVYEQFRRVLNMLKARVVESNSSNILGYDIETMLISCYFDDRKCDTSDFVKFQMFEYINCFTYNTRADIKRTARTRKGLSLELFAGNASELSIELGFYVIVHNNSVIPLKKRGFKVPTGRGADIGVQRIVESNLVDCRPSVTVASSSDSAYYKVAASQPSTVYFQQLCFQVCLQDAIEIKCNCSEPSLALYTKRNVCATLDALDCASDERNRFLASPEWLTTCTQACPRECNSVDFTPNLHYSNYVRLLSYYRYSACCFFFFCFFFISNRIDCVDETKKAVAKLLQSDGEEARLCQAFSQFDHVQLVPAKCGSDQRLLRGHDIHRVHRVARSHARHTQRYHRYVNIEKKKTQLSSYFRS